jgi:hypothetical protein
LALFALITQIGEIKTGQCALGKSVSGHDQRPSEDEGEGAEEAR